MIHARNRFAPVLYCLALSLAAVQPAGASDGVLEINAACVATGCLAGDEPGYPITLTQPGSYRLTGNLARSTLFNQELSGDTIEIQARNVKLDLNGFTISCASFAPAADRCVQGMATGIHVRGDSVRVSNGHIRGMPGWGLRGDSDSDGLVVEDLSAVANDSIGLLLTGEGSVVRRAEVRDNGSKGIVVAHRSLVLESISIDNAGTGISTTLSSQEAGYRDCVTDSRENMTTLGSNLVLP